jgi:ABC-type multidrug transport system ATPase subunit
MKLEIKNLIKKYNDVRALDGFSVTMTQGVYGLLGPNGAGKSTLMNILTDNLKRDDGEILYDGKEILEMGADYRKIVGYMPPSLHEKRKGKNGICKIYKWFSAFILCAVYNVCSAFCAGGYCIWIS